MKSQRLPDYFISFLKENLTYKILSFIIAIALWYIVFNKKEFIVSWDMQVQVILNAEQKLVNQTADKVRVRMSGPRNLIQTYRDSNAAKNLKIDLSRRGDGIFEVDINGNMLDAPRGVKVLSIRPNLIRIDVRIDKAQVDSIQTETAPTPEGQ